MDRGIPTEETLALMRASDPPVHYLVGTPKGRLTKLEKSFLTKPWVTVRDQVTVKLLDQDGELYVLALSAGRPEKERAMRQRRLKRLWKRLHELQRQTLSRDDLLLKLGAAKKGAGRASGLVRIQVPAPDEPVTAATFTFVLNRKKLRQARRREGRYLLRSNQQRPSSTLDLVYLTHRNRTGVQRAQGRPEYSSHLPPTGYADRGAYLCGLPGLLPPGHPEGLSAAPRTGPDPALRLGEIRRHPDGRCPSAHHRRTNPGLEPLHRAGARPQLLLDRLHLQLPAQPPPRITATLEARLL